MNRKIESLVGPSLSPLPAKRPPARGNSNLTRYPAIPLSGRNPILLAAINLFPSGE